MNNIVTARSIEELLTLSDSRFVQCAYLTLLQRDADDDGLKHHLSKLHNGYDKVQIIVDLATSPEALNLTIHVEGLRALLNFYKRRRSYIGRFWNQIFPNTENLFLIRRTLSRLELLIESKAASFNDDVQNILAHSTNTLERLDSLSNRIAKIELAPSLVVISQPVEILEEIPEIIFAIDVRPHVYYFNLTSSHHWRAHPVGIIRLERELAKYLAKFEQVDFVVWDLQAKGFRLLNRQDVAIILSADWTVSGTVPVLESFQRPVMQLRSQSKFISVGLDWDLSPLHEVSSTLRKSQVEAIYACYDLVPIKFPEYCADQRFDQVFKRHFVEMAHDASMVFVDSENTKQDLLEFWETAELVSDFPVTKFVPLAAASNLNSLPELSIAAQSIINHVEFLGEYVIYVSSFEARKNHRLLINVWRALYDERGDDCPQLVLVGMKGWGTTDLINQISRMPAYKAGKINWLQNVGDDTLLHLYAKSLFSVFPSLYEGWGLAATEAMSFGKICLVSNNSALAEATQNLMPSLHPLDYPGWKREIDRLLDDHSYRNKLEERIKNEFIVREWDDFSREFCTELMFDVSVAPLYEDARSQIALSTT